MITLATAEEMLHAPFRVLPKMPQLLEYIEPTGWRWKTRHDGTEEPWITLRKALPGCPVGMMMRLADLHARLCGGFAK
jgi:hypothetical protein